MPAEPHDRPVLAAAATPAGRHPPGRERSSVSSAAASTAPARERPRQGLAARPEVGLVGVVPAERVPGDAGQVDPAGPVEVAERDHHPHRRHVGHGVARRRRPTRSRRRRRCRRRASQPPRLTSHSHRADARLPERRLSQLELVQVAPGPVVRVERPGAGSSRRGRRSSPRPGCRRGSRRRRRWSRRPTRSRSGASSSRSHRPRPSGRRRRATAPRAGRRGRSREHVAPDRR